MKHCPICGRIYGDDSLSHCLDDGSQLSPAADPEATLIATASSSSTPTPPFRRQSSTPWRGWMIYPAVFMLMVLLGAGAGWLIYKFNKHSAPVLSSLPPDSPPPVTASSAQSFPSLGASVAQSAKDIESLSGTWNVVNTVDKTSYPAFAKLRVGYRLSIIQTGEKFTGEGEKVSENGMTLPSGGRTKIHLTGIAGRTITAEFIEEGTRRKTGGTFEWKPDAKGNVMTGTFVSTAANSSGTSIATKEP